MVLLGGMGNVTGNLLYHVYERWTVTAGWQRSPTNIRFDLRSGALDDVADDYFFMGGT